MDFRKILIVPFAPTLIWSLGRDEVVINLGDHWPLQPPARNIRKDLIKPKRCDGSLLIALDHSTGASPISLLCDEPGCDLHIDSKTHKNRIKKWDVRLLKLALARLMLAGAVWDDETFSIKLPSVPFEGENCTEAAMPLMDTGFSTKDGKDIHLALLLPRKIADWKDETVHEEVFDNLADSARFVITELLANSRTLELANKHVIGRQ